MWFYMVHLHFQVEPDSGFFPVIGEQHVKWWDFDEISLRFFFYLLHKY